MWRWRHHVAPLSARGVDHQPRALVHHLTFDHVILLRHHFAPHDFRGLFALQKHVILILITDPVPSNTTRQYILSNPVKVQCNRVWEVKCKEKQFGMKTEHEKAGPWVRVTMWHTRLSTDFLEESEGEDAHGNEDASNTMGRGSSHECLGRLRLRLSRVYTGRRLRAAAGLRSRTGTGAGAGAG